MQHYICKTCGVQYEKTLETPQECIICSDERQYVSPSGQTWTTLDAMVESENYKNDLCVEEKGLYSITTTPKVGIGQTAYVVEQDDFRVLWDCITYLDEQTIMQIKESGGIDAIALSHPHYYSTQVAWAETFDVPIYIHEDDQKWVRRPSDRIILTGDVIQVVPDQNWVSFMYSYPNLIPLPAEKVRDITSKVGALPFNRIYNAFHRIVKEDARAAVQKSAERYIAALDGTLFQT